MRWYAGLRRLAATSLRLHSLDGIRHVAASLEWLSLGDTLTPRSLRPLSGLPIRCLGINGTWKDIEVVSSLARLERLGVSSIDVELPLPLTELRRLESGLGTVRSLQRLPEVGRLELVELYRLRGEHDLAPLADIPTLRYLLLASTRSITRLPSFARSPELRCVALDEMRGITDLQPVAEAPNLEVLLLIGMRQLGVEQLRPLVGHPTLRAGIWGLGSLRRNEAADVLVGVPPFGHAGPPWNASDWDGIPHPTRS